VERFEISSSLKVIWFFAVKGEPQINSEWLFGKSVACPARQGRGDGIVGKYFVTTKAHQGVI
jgi:hypothetical protein